MNASEIDDLISCSNCGIVCNVDYVQKEDNKKDWYGTDRTWTCPCCKTKHTYNLGDGYYK